MDDLHIKDEKVRRFVERTASVSSMEEMVEVYDDWAKTYDQDLEKIGTQEHVAVDEVTFILGNKKKARILDLAAGPGTIGKMLYDKGYTNIDAIDASQKMLNIAKTKNVYQNLICAFVDDKPLDIPSETYDMIVGVGCLADSHVATKSFPEIIRITKKGGFIVFLTALYDWFDNDKYEAKMDRLSRLKLWKRTATKYIPKYWGDEMGICYTLTKT